MGKNKNLVLEKTLFKSKKINFMKYNFKITINNNWPIIFLKKGY